MSDEPLNQPQPVPDEEMNTTPPNPPQSGATGAWSMPEPVFKQTSGYLPQGYEKNFPQVEPEPVATADDSIEPAMVAAFAEEDIEPQPDITEAPDLPVAVAGTPQPPKNGGAMKVIFTLFGLLVALAIIIVFIAVIYSFFLMPSNGSTF